MATITLRGKPVNTNGELPAIGADAPPFKLTASDLGDKTLADYSGKKKLLNIVPSLDTRVCAVSTKAFNESAASFPEAVILVVSADLPFAQSRFCKSEKTGDVITLSEMRNKSFAKDYGVLLQDGPLAGITTRAVVVIDENDKIVYTELVPEISQEPDYEKALAALS